MQAKAKPVEQVKSAQDASDVRQRPYPRSGRQGRAWDSFAQGREVRWSWRAATWATLFISAEKLYRTIRDRERA